METLESAALQLAGDKKEAGYLLYSAHMAGMLSFPVLFLLIPMLRIPIMISFFPLFMYHLVYKRCPVTRIERRLHGDDVTVLDPFIKLLGLNPTDTNRKIMQVFLSTIAMGVMIYYISIKST
jgi:hypothetical protein